MSPIPFGLNFDNFRRQRNILLTLKDYQKMETIIEDMEDTIDLLRAEREAVSFTPYEKFRKKWLSE